MANTPSKEDRLNEWRSQWSTPSSQPSAQVSSQGSKEDRLTEWRNQWSKPAVETTPSPATYKAGSGIVDALAGVTGRKAEAYTPKPVVNPEPTRQQRRAEMLDEQFTPSVPVAPTAPSAPNRIVSDAGMNFSNSAQALANAAPVASERGQGLNPVTPYEAQKQQEKAQNDFNNLNRQIQEYDLALGMADTPEAQAEINAKRAPLVEQRERLLQENPSITDYDKAQSKAFWGAINTGNDAALSRITTFLDKTIGLGDALQEVFYMFGINRDNPIKAFNNYVHKVAEHNQEYYKEQTKGDPTAQAILNYGGQTVAAVPAMLFAMATAGASTAGTAGLEATAYLNSLSGAEQTMYQVSNAVNTMMANPSWQLSFAQEAGSAYESALDKGLDEAEAAVYSTLYGYLSATVEVGGTSEAAGGLEQYYKDVKKGNISNGLIARAKEIAGEIGEENIQGMLERGLLGLFGQDTKLVSNDPNQNAIIKPNEMAEEAKGAAIVSALLGIPGSVSNINSMATVEPETAPVATQSVEDALTPDMRANQIVRNPQARTAFQDMYGVALPSSNTEAERIVSQILRAQNAPQTTAVENAPVETPVEVQEAPAPAYTSAQEQVIDLLTQPNGVKFSDANRILSDATLWDAFQSLFPNVDTNQSRTNLKEEIRTADLSEMAAPDGTVPTAETDTSPTAEEAEPIAEPVEAPSAPTVETEEVTQPVAEAEETEQTATEAPAQETQEEAPQEKKVPKSVARLDDPNLTPTQKKAARILVNGSEMTDADIDSLLSNKATMNALKRFGWEEKGGTFREQRQSVRDFADSLINGGIPSAREVAKANQDKAIRTTEQRLQYDLEQAQEQLKAMEQQHASEMRSALASQRTELAERHARAIEAKKQQIEKAKARLTKYKQAVADARARAKARKAAGLERAAVKKAISDIDTKIKEMTAKERSPSEKKYIPVELQKTVTDLIATITESRAGEKFVEIEQKLEDIGNKLSTASPDEIDSLLRERDTLIKRDERTQANFGKILDVVRKMRGTNAYSMDSDFLDLYENTVEKVAEDLGATPFYQMNSQQLKEVYKVLNDLDTFAKQRVKQKIRGEERAMFDEGRQMLHETTDARYFINGDPEGKGLLNGAKNAITKMDFSSMTPVDAFNVFGGRHEDSMWNEWAKTFQDAETDKTGMIVEGTQMFEHLIDRRSSGKNTRATMTLDSVKTQSGKPLKISHGMARYLYMLANTEDGRRSLIGGGFVKPNDGDYYRGVNDNGYGTTASRAMGNVEEINNLRNANSHLAEDIERLEESTVRDEEWQAELDEAVAKYDDNFARIEMLMEENGQSVDDLIAELDSKLTDEDMEWIDAAKRLFKMAGDEINKTTTEVYGFEKATVEDYVPLSRDKDFVKTSLSQMNKDLSAEDWGRMKKRSAFATQPLLLFDLADVCGSYLEKAATYSKIMPAARQFNMAWNTTEYTDTGTGKTESLRSAVRQKFGNAGVNYVENVLKDLQGISRRGTDDVSGLSRGLQRARSGLARSALSLNPGVALGQTASYVGAMDKIPARYLLKALANPQNRASRDSIISKYSPLQRSRSLGSMGEAAKADANVVDDAFRKANWAFGWITGMDTGTTSKLWQAAEYYVEGDPKRGGLGIDRNSEDFYPTVTEVWEDTLRKTQPAYNIMNRPDILRTPNDLVKSLTMFKTQPFQYLNMVRNSAMNLEQAQYDLKQARASGDSDAVQKAEAAVKQNGQKLARTFAAVTAANVTYVVMRSLVDGAMHRWDKFRDKETGDITAQSVLKRLAWMMGEMTFGMIPFGSELFTAIESVITGNTYYGISANGVSLISETVEDFVNLGKAVYDGKDDEKIKTKTMNALKSMLNLKGIPAGNADKIYQAYRTWSDEIHNMIENDAELDALYERTATQNKNRLRTALEEGDEEKIDAVASSMDSKTANSVVNAFATEVAAKDAGWENSDQYKKDKATVDEYRTGKKNDFDSVGVRNAAEYILNADRTDEQKDMLMLTVGSAFNSDYQVVRGEGLSPEKAINLLLNIDANQEGSNDKHKKNGSITQAEIQSYYADHPEEEDIIGALWDSKNYKRSGQQFTWSDYLASLGQ